MDFLNYTIEKYKKDIDRYGMEETWNAILSYRMMGTPYPDLLSIQNFGELYEIGLAHTNKVSKKEQGKYFTPGDVSGLLSVFLQDIRAENVCDVCCGTGNLILSYLNSIGRENATRLISDGHLYLYDLDALALKICATSIGLWYGMDLIEHIHLVQGDFLDKDIYLPSTCKVISNPPYFKIKEFGENWEITDVISESRDFYVAIMEKIIRNSQASVIITPFSFIGGNKFYSFRKFLNNYNGFVFSFDNVPANIFRGKKHGIFNSNSSNAVRAAITVVENIPGKRGFRISPLIRFQTEERERLIHKDILMNYLPAEYQMVSDRQRRYHKCFSQLEDVYEEWTSQADGTFDELLSDTPTAYRLCVPTTCRYFLSATQRDLQREGKNYFYFKDKDAYDFAYCILNSSFAYWHWRLFDGGITYPTGLLKSMPIKYFSLSEKEKEQMHTLVMDARKEEGEYLIYKKNASEIQENVKFPKEYRYRFNQSILETLSARENADVFDCVHSNSFFGGE